jgi:uncharacterized 2Fe-2S/4Fe-4S cluster protein (DUF4445 family)
VTSPRCRVRFLPEDRVSEVETPVELYLAAASAGILLEQPCGSQATCGRCRVRVIEGAPPPSDAERSIFTPTDLDAGWRLGCQLVIATSAVIEIPSVTRSLAGKSFGDDLPPEALDHPVVAAQLEAQRPRFGLAIDVGTTSLAAALVSLSDGSVAASASALNPQSAFGADVISRIRHTTEAVEGLAHLQDAVRAGLGTLVHELMADARCDASQVVLSAVAGNPTMMHAWLGVPVASLGRAPFEAAWSGALTLKAGAVGLPIEPDAAVLVFPLVRSHVGGDLVAAAVACGFDHVEESRASGPRLLIDLGTNTELLLECDGRLVTTSAAAGPAFEGGAIRHGMRGAPGAIDVVSISADGRVRTHTIGGLPARGLCGSGLIDAVAELLRAGVVSASGYLRKPAEVRLGALAARLSSIDGQQVFTLVEGDDATAAGPVTITARDIREVQLAKGSILAAATLLCRHAGLSPGELRDVLVAGAFGNYIRKSSALDIGLLPPIDPERVRFVGNAAGVGARLALIDARVTERAGRLAARAEYVDLAGHADYQAAFMAALAFPER